MGYEQTSLVFKLLTYNLITSQYMLTSWIQRQELIQKPSAAMGKYGKGIQNEVK